MKLLAITIVTAALSTGCATSVADQYTSVKNTFCSSSDVNIFRANGGMYIQCTDGSMFHLQERGSIDGQYDKFLDRKDVVCGDKDVILYRSDLRKVVIKCSDRTEVVL